MKENSEISTWLNNAGKYPLLTPEETTLLSREIQALPEDSPKRKKLVSKLVQHNLRLVVKFVRSFMGPSCHNKWGSPETIDYLQVGAMGLIRAAEKYDPTKGYTFSTYAGHWIRSKICRYNLKNRSTVHVNECAMRRLVFYKRNGYISTRSSTGRLDDKTADQVLRQIESAISCVSLNVPSETGSEMINSIPNPENHERREEVYDSVQSGLDQAGITALGKEILLAIHAYDESTAQVAERLNISQNKVRSERREAIKLAQASPAMRQLVGIRSVD